MIALILVLVLVTGALSESDETSTTPNQYKWLDVPYAYASAAQKLDIYLPNIYSHNDVKGPFPVIVSIHGGGYEAGDKVGPDVLTAWEGLKRGYAVVSVNYRLSSEAIFPAQINDIKAAIRFIRANARNYDLNPEKIAVWGSSAGGGLAALAGTSGKIIELQDPSLGYMFQSDRVQAVVDWCGPINFLTMDEQFKQSGIAGHLQDNPDSFGSKLMGKQITQVPDLVTMANPETYITRDDPPFFIQQGSEDKWIPMQQSTEFAAKLQAVLGKDKVEIEVIQGAGHGGKRFNSPENVNKVLDFLDKNLK
ncbi:MAG: alpha/beta hydrolase [Firmicutes bacterium HGW-Firmicutes-15]|nr:MAG: alpha/beta hydrolase [Firmicutes bacterium HGW-Firmicutes-15]